LELSKNYEFEKNVHLLIEFNADITTDGKRNVCYQGILFLLTLMLEQKFNIRNIVFLRGGIGNIQKTPDLTGKYNLYHSTKFRFGINIKGVEY
jgi:hypothetical protein